jgi:hypothetical protein
MPTPPDSLPDDASALKALLVAAQAENERLIAIIKELQRYRFGPRSEKIDPGQLALMLEDVEQAIAASAAQAESQTEDQPAKTPVQRKRQVNRGALPKHLPREDVVVDIADKSCRGGRHCQIRRPSAALPSGPDLWPPGRRTRSLDAGRLVGPRRLRAASRA